MARQRCLLLVCAAVCSLILQLGPLVKASAIVAGSVYSSGCSYPLEAVWNQTCPQPAALTTANALSGQAQFNLSGPAAGDFPPNVNLSMSLYRFSGIDQKLFTFTATVKLTMYYLDSRAVATIANASNASSCKKPCTWGSNGMGACCDGMWLPTLNFLNAQTGSVTTEDYNIQAYELPVAGAPSQGFVKYMLTVNSVFLQPFDFHAFPFDRHALAVRVQCVDCDMHLFQGYQGLSVYLGGWLRASPGDPTAASGYSGYNTSVKGALGASMDGRGFPASSGWQLNGVDLVMANFTERDTHNPPTSSAALAVGVPDFFGAVFMVYTQRVTRLYYVLQTIIPPILLVLLGFTAFITPKDRFPDRLRTLAPVMISVYIFQLTLTAILPSTYTLLAPNYLVFVSMMTVALLALIALTSYTIVNRQKAVERRIKTNKGRDKWRKKAPALFPKKAPGLAAKGSVAIASAPSADVDAEAPLPPPSTLPSHKDPDMCIHCAATAEEKQKEEEKKEKHEAVVTEMARSHHKSRLFGYRTVRIWWAAMALDGVAGYRDHVAEIFELCALVVVFLLYAVALIALFVTAGHEGQNINQV